MFIEELIGKTITNIYTIVEYQINGLDKGECFIELDNTIIIDIPFGDPTDVWVKELDKKAQSVFVNLSDIPISFVNKEQKTIQEIVDKYSAYQRTFFGRLKKLFGIKTEINEYQPYNIEYQENKLRYIQNRKIVDFLWYDDEIEKGYILLDNGYTITETTTANHGTGIVGLNYYENLEKLTATKGCGILRLADRIKCSS